MTNVALINNPRSSSGLGDYVADSLVQEGCVITRIDPHGAKWRKLLPVLCSMRLNPDAMWKARWENMVFSSWAWKRNSRRNTKLLAGVYSK